MFGPWIVAFGWLKDRMPKKISAFKPKLNYITLHYTYLISMALLGSIMVYPAGRMAYVDALFLSTGAVTQSGLNTIDLNKLHLYQQIVFLTQAVMCNPIFINTFVVFVRLYWFEKRFQNVVVEARSLRRNKTRSRTRSQAKGDADPDPAREEIGVGNREIVVLREPNGAAKGKKIEDENECREKADETSSAEGSNKGPLDDSVSPTDTSAKEQASVPFRRDIMFADEVEPARAEGERRLSNSERMPEQRSKEQNIAFVENQRNPKDGGTLRIPGPRDFDRGLVPQRIEEGDDGSLNKEMSNEEEVNFGRQRQRSNSVPPQELNADDHPLKQHIAFDTPDQRRPPTGPSVYEVGGRGASSGNDHEGASYGMKLRNRARSKTLGSLLSREKDEERDPMPYLSWQPTVGRNSAFVDLTEEQREELGGIEYRSLKLLAIILVCYYIGFYVLGVLVLLPWMVNSRKYSDLVREDSINPVWWTFFTTASLFCDLGFTLTPDSMVSFQKTVPPLLIGAFLIVIGNTGFPCMLRLIIWVCHKCVPYGSGLWEELRFLLDHPRRCFTLLFPSNANWWLVWVLILLNGIDVFFFLILDVKSPATEGIPGGFRFLDGLFQATSTRTAGFSAISLADIHPAVQVSYVIMMYISVFPIAISMRQTNVYEEKSLGVWANNEEDANSSYLGTHLRRQLSFDLWYVFLGFFLITIVEGKRLQNTNDYSFTLFSVLFETVSAYGTVGLSIGYPGKNYSLSGEFKPLSKLIIIAMQLRGRHRGLPYALDRAILLPSEALHRKEDEDATLRARRNSNAGDLPGAGFMRAGTDISRRGSRASSATGEGMSPLSRIARSREIGRFLGGALAAGPSIPRERKV